MKGQMIHTTAVLLMNAMEAGDGLPHLVPECTQ